MLRLLKSGRYRSQAQLAPVLGHSDRTLRRWCPWVHRRPWVVQDRYEWLWLYAAAEPTTGESCWLYLSYLDAVCFQLFIDELGRADADDFLLVVMDQAGSHLSATWYPR